MACARTADRGACHQRAWPIAYEVKGAKGPDGKLVERYGPEGKALVTKTDQDGNATLFSLVACDFAAGQLVGTILGNAETHGQQV